MSDLFCPYCGSDNVDIEGAVSHGDGDLSDECCCRDCCEVFEINTVWFDDEGNRFATEDQMWNFGIFVDEEP